MFLRDRLSSGSAEAFSATKEIQPRAKLLTNRVEEPLAPKLRCRVELWQLSMNSRCRDRGQQIHYPAKSPGRFDDAIMIDGAGTSLHPCVIGDLEELGQHAYCLRVRLQN